MTIETKLIALAQAMGADVKALKAADGDLTALSTTAKGNLVAALNEVFDLVDAIEGDDPTKLPLAGGTLTGALNLAVPLDYNPALSGGVLNWDLLASNTGFSTTTASISSMTGATDGAYRVIKFAAGITLTHTANTLELPGTASITTGQGDSGIFLRRSATRWQCVVYTRGDGTALVGGAYLPLAGGRMTGAINHAGYGTINAADNLNLGAVNANTVRIDNPGAGAVTINNIASGTSGTRRIVFFNGTGVTLVHNSGLTILPGNANIVAAPGDHAEFACEGGATWRCMWYTRRDGTALVSSAAGPVIDDTAGTGDTDVVWSADKSVTFVTAAVATLEASLMGGAGEAYDTFKELQDLIIADQSGLAALAADIQNRVRFDAAQTLTAPQKTQARDNIGAASQADIDATIVATVGDVAHDFVADYEAAKA